MVAAQSPITRTAPTIQGTPITLAAVHGLAFDDFAGIAAKHRAEAEAAGQDTPELRVGDWVRMKGVAFNPYYQNKVFKVENPDVGDGRVLLTYEVSERSRKKLYCAPSARTLRPAAS